MKLLTFPIWTHCRVNYILFRIYVYKRWDGNFSFLCGLLEMLIHTNLIWLWNRKHNYFIGKGIFFFFFEKFKFRELVDSFIVSNYAMQTLLYLPKDLCRSKSWMSLLFGNLQRFWCVYAPVPNEKKIPALENLATTWLPF